MHKIALSGKMKSGKTTLAKEVALGYPVIHSFAGPIRNALMDLGIDKNTHPELYREAAQYIGTDLVRAYNPDWWVNLMQQKLDDCTNSPDYKHEIFIIDDMRFENEFDFCQRNGFFTIRLDVSEGTQLARGAEPTRLDHPSETALDHITREEWDLWLPEDTTPYDRSVEIAFLLLSQMQPA